MKALFDSLVRTYVPWLAGVIIGWLISLGVPLDPDVEVQVTLTLMGAASVLWYAIARVFELYVHPKLGWLIGLPKQPLYDKQAVQDDALVRLANLDADERNTDVQAAVARASLRRDRR